MQELDLLQSLNVSPNFTPTIEPILASGQEAPKPALVARVPIAQEPVAAVTQPVPTEPAASAAAISTNRLLPQQEQKFSDYSSYGYLNTWVKEECCSKIPNYRLPASCSNCAFSTYEPVEEHAICKKWNQRVIPFYYCDSHVDPATLLGSSDSKEMFSETAQPALATVVQSQDAIVPVNSEFSDQELYVEALLAAPSFMNQDGVKDETLTNLYIKRKYEQLVKQKSSQVI